MLPLLDLEAQNVAGQDTERLGRKRLRSQLQRQRDGDHCLHLRTNTVRRMRLDISCGLRQLSGAHQPTPVQDLPSSPKPATDLAFHKGRVAGRVPQHALPQRQFQRLQVCIDENQIWELD